MLLEPEAIPDRFWVFVDQTNPLTWHNFNLTGGLFSSSLVNQELGVPDGQMPYIRNPDPVAGAISPFLTSTLAPWGVELDAERVRRDVSPGSPSRLSCVYAFGSVEDCNEAVRLYGWDPNEIRTLRLNRSLPFRVARVNMGVISMARHAYARAVLDAPTIDALWTEYWNGLSGLPLALPAPPPENQRTYVPEQVWEYLIHGGLLRDDTI